MVSDLGPAPTCRLAGAYFVNHTWKLIDTSVISATLTPFVCVCVHVC